MAFIPTCRWLVVHSSLMFVVSLAGIFNVAGVCRWLFISRRSMLCAIFTMLSYDPSWSLKSDRDRSVPDDVMRLAVAPIMEHRLCMSDRPFPCQYPPCRRCNLLCQELPFLLRLPIVALIANRLTLPISTLFTPSTPLATAIVLESEEE
ncbi:hypothetical protein BHM03_00017416 [Ensete ventricosum]|nr:hypothetical protein BHM03_00017416 [Ensete ventricosum]